MAKIKEVLSKRRLIFFVVFLMVVVMPFLTFSGSEKKIYVDDSATGTRDGSIDHPFKTIEEAMDEADDDTEIHIAKGHYKENVKIKEGVEIFGEDMDDVVIEAEDEDDPVVIMKNKTKINKVTVREGDNGIEVEEDAKVSIIKCKIEDNDGDGVNIKSGPLKDSKMVSISKSEIKNNDGAGVYSKKRRLSLVENEIRNNGSDGIDIEKGSSAWIDSNDVFDNEKSGIKLRIDGSDIWLRKNEVKNNVRDGLEISFSGNSGRINVSKSEFKGNGKYGMAKIQRGSFSNNASLWRKYLTIESGNVIEKNKSGSVSEIIFH